MVSLGINFPPPRICIKYPPKPSDVINAMSSLTKAFGQRNSWDYKVAIDGLPEELSGDAFYHASLGCPFRTTEIDIQVKISEAQANIWNTKKIQMTLIRREKPKNEPMIKVTYSLPEKLRAPQWNTVFYLNTIKGIFVPEPDFYCCNNNCCAHIR